MAVESNLSVRWGQSKSDYKQKQLFSLSSLSQLRQHVALAPFCLCYYVCVHAVKSNCLLFHFLHVVNFCPGE